MHSLLKLLHRTHWTVHCLGTGSLFTTIIALQSLLISPNTEHIHLALFDLLAGLAGLCLAIVFLLSQERERRTERRPKQRP
jgi:hypothetical protein